jgi:hypothetical protein
MAVGVGDIFLALRVVGHSSIMIINTEHALLFYLLDSPWRDNEHDITRELPNI